MTDHRIAKSTAVGAPSSRFRWLRHVGLAGALIVALVELSERLGASSLFVDEVYSWRAADVPLTELLHRVRVDEVAPPTYYVMLKVWIALFGSDSEAVMRALSVVAAVATVAAVYWVANLLAGRLIGSVAALLAAVSPLVLEYGQEVRAYAWAMLAVTVAAGAVLQAEQDARRRVRWLALGAAAAIASLWLHYSAILVIAPLTAFVLASHGWLSRGQRLRFTVAVGIGGALVLPILRAQFQAGHQNAVAAIAQLTADNVKRVIGAPFDRTYNLLSATSATLGCALVLAAVILLLLPRARANLSHPRLLAGLAATAPALLLLVTATGTKVLISRYDAVAVPFIVIALAATIAVFRPAGLLVVVVALVIAVPASIRAHQVDRAYPDTRAAMTIVSRHWLPGDVLIIGTGYPAIGYNLQYYATHLLPKTAPVSYGQPLSIIFTVANQKQVRGIALITEPVGPLAQVESNFFGKAGLHITGAGQTGGTLPMQAFIGARG
jgi:uncharacterized membrane protein